MGEEKKEKKEKRIKALIKNTNFLAVEDRREIFIIYFTFIFILIGILCRIKGPQFLRLTVSTRRGNDVDALSLGHALCGF